MLPHWALVKVSSGLDSLVLKADRTHCCLLSRLFSIDSENDYESVLINVTRSLCHLIVLFVLVIAISLIDLFSAGASVVHCSSKMKSSEETLFNKCSETVHLQ